jgi:hypothetical protein
MYTTLSIICDAGICREKLRQLELHTKHSSKASSCSAASSAPAAAASVADLLTSGSVAAAMDHDLRLLLNQDLVAASVKLDGMQRRLEMLEREKDRINQSLSEAQVGRPTLSSTLGRRPADPKNE